MKRLLAIAALLAACAVVPVLADAAKPVDPGVTASTGTKADLGTVTSAIMASRTSAIAIQAMTTVGTVNIVKISEVAGDDKQALERIIADNEPDITGLQAAIMANSALKTELDKATIDTSAIVAANIEADGAVTVFVK
ncbi:hypothetical protein [Aminobacter sp. AP02]|uniref:hypothetical protein n=1 Tax=Aminobacter sp. AP02 TaxID=2135737 RepID=UPI000D6BFEDD|nr:hypothetical protein [Aminobacter sp. AP02]PWK76238.1 hypothetical protein C8K44_102225 [Aminobacter sp. AP02]